jgi:hypothetical protein
VLFGDISDVFAGLPGRMQDMSIDGNAARGGFDKIEKHPDDGRLAGTVGPQQVQKTLPFESYMKHYRPLLRAKFFCNGIKCDHNRTVKKDVGVFESDLI